MREEGFSGRGGATAGAAASGQAAFANITIGHLRARSACSRPGTLTIEVYGELDIATAPALEQLLREVERDRWPTVVLDLAQMSFIDSSGIRALLAANHRISGEGGHMFVRHSSRPVRRALAAIGAERILDLTDVVDEPTRTGEVHRPHPDLHASTSSGNGRPSSGRARQPPAALSVVADSQPAGGQTLMEVTNAVVSACKAHAGKGPQRAQAHLRANALYVVLHDWMTVAEHTLVALGRQDLIAESRRHLNDQVADATRSTVEHAIGRSVIATRSHIDLDRNTAILAFALGPAA
jgi:anti-sigma B factor antagonist